MTDTTPTPAPKGVQFNAPPADLQPQIRASINRAVERLETTGRNGALVTLANEQGINGAIVNRLTSDNGRVTWDVTVWIGKTWHGDTQYGATVEATW